MKKKIGIIGVILLMIGIIISITWYNYSLSAVSKTDSYKEIEIPKGMSSIKIVQLLKNEGLIRSVNATKIYLFFHKDLSFQAGLYKISSGSTTKEILSILANGLITKNTVSVTLIPGKRLTSYISTLANDLNLEETDFYDAMNDLKFQEKIIADYWFLTEEIQNKEIYYPLEGYILPDTYEFNKGIDAKTTIKRLLDYTKTKLDSQKQAIEESKYTPHEILSLASIAELEANTKEDRQMVSQVIEKRLELKMGLGMDVTTYYAVKKEMGDTLTMKDLATKSAYNTSESNPSMAGKIPVGPICNPSMSSIEAILNPSDTEYLYFFANINTGKVCFTKNYQEHQKVIKEGCN